MARSTIFDAIASGSVSRVKRFLTLHPDSVGERNEDGLSPLAAALYHGDEEIVAVLIERGAPVSHFEAAALGDLELLERQLRRSVKRATAYSPDGFTALHYAAYFGHSEAAALLLRQGADVEAESRDERGWRPLHMAVRGASPLELAQLLVEAGADPNAEESGGWTALHSAAGSGNLALVQFLLARGARAWTEAYDMTRPLDFAIERGHLEIVRVLKRQPRRTRASGGRPATRRSPGPARL